jgi:hypothetical protein
MDFMISRAQDLSKNRSINDMQNAAIPDHMWHVHVLNLMLSSLQLNSMTLSNLQAVIGRGVTFPGRSEFIQTKHQSRASCKGDQSA